VKVKLFYFKHFVGSQNSQASSLPLEVTLDSVPLVTLLSLDVTDDSLVVTDDSLVVTELLEEESPSFMHLYPIGLLFSVNNYSL